VKDIASNFSSSFYITCLFQFQQCYFFTETVFWRSWSWSWSWDYWSWSWNSGLDYKTRIKTTEGMWCKVVV